MTSRQANSVTAGHVDAVSQEQAYVDMLYRLLDTARARTEQALARSHGSGGAGGTFQARVERDIAAAEQGRRLAQLNAVERGMVFGRTDGRGAGSDGQTGEAGPDGAPATLYIGRIGLRDDEHEPKLIDWRAPAARPFYAATPKDPDGLIRRRHIYTRARTVTGVDDEVFDLDQLSEPDRQSLSGEAMLIASITAERTGRMTDVVATIQAEQDRVIRAGLQGVLVVQGGPGTGKTVAALHRAAYLLYTHRRTLERRGVLVIGPNATFLRYISQVLPSLGETDVVLTSMAELFPGVFAAPDDDPAAAEIKGDLKMASVLRRAVRDRQRVPRGDLEVTVDGVRMTVPRETVLRARDRGRSARRPHNVARRQFVTEMLGALATAEAAALGRPVDTDDLPYTRARLWDEPPVRAALDGLWPYLTPQRVVAGLLGDEGALRRAAAALSAAQRDVILRPGAPEAWTVADVPLLDEAAQLLGSDDSADRRRRRSADTERQSEEQYAREVLEITGVAESGFVDAATLADWNRDPGQQLTTAERAWADPSWAYGHVIVDEAQELSAMAWRMVMRRIPTRSMTVVGPVLGADARHLRRRPVAGGTPHGELPHSGRDHGRCRRRAGRGRPRRAAARVRPRGGCLPPRGRRPRPRPRGRGRGTGRDGRRRPAGGHRAHGPDDRAGPGHPCGRARRPGRGARRTSRPAHRGPGQGPGVRPGGAGRPSRDRGPVPGGRARPVRGLDPRHPPPHRRLRRRAPGVAASPGALTVPAR
jgi:DNA helicase IV